MKLEHAAVYFKDLEAAKDFFTQYFGAMCSEKYHNKTTGFCSYFLSFEGETGARLEIMTKPGLVDAAKEPERTGYAHMAFSVGSKQAVDDLTERLSMAGYPILGGPRVTGDGYYESCVLGPEENRVEITV